MRMYEEGIWCLLCRGAFHFFNFRNIDTGLLEIQMSLFCFRDGVVNCVMKLTVFLEKSHTGFML